MKRYSRLAVIALIVLLVGAGAFVLVKRSLNKRASSRTLQEDNIAEVVFRHEIDESHRQEGYSMFFLSRGERIDPTDTFMRRFANKGYVVKPVSQSVILYDGVRDKSSPKGDRGLILGIHRITWVTGTEAAVGVSTFSWGWGQSASVCRVVLENGAWVVKNCDLTLIT
jgi:hypothetical protein